MGKTTKNRLSKIIKLASSIEGWISIQEGYFLYQLASRLPQKAVVVEIGSWKGKSTVWLGSGLKKNQSAELYSVDPHYGNQKNKRQKTDSRSEFKKNIVKAGLGKGVRSICQTSEAAWADFSPKVDLLFIDGSHVYESVRKDFVLWSKKLNPGAWVVFHDANILPGPWKVARDNLLLTSRFGNTGMLGSMVYGQYFTQITFRRKLINFSRNILICLFTALYARMRKIRVPRWGRYMIRRLNFKWRINQLKNVAPKSNHPSH